MARHEEQKWNLLGSGQDSYSGQNAQNPATSRLIQSWIVQDDGQLHRELPEPFYAYTTATTAGQALPGPVVGLYEFDQNNGQGAINRFYFAAARVNSTVGTQNCLLYQSVTTSTNTSWVQVAAVSTLANAPMCITQENNFFLSDGVSNWLFNGTIWVPTGIQIPLNPPAINIASQGNPQVTISNQAFTVADASLPSGGVGVYLYATNATYDDFNGTVALLHPLTAAASTASVINSTDPSLLFNAPQSCNGVYDPQISPMRWGYMTSASNSTTGYQVLPYPANTSISYEMVVLCQLNIPVKGTYTVAFNHDDGAIFGMGAGNATGAVPVCSGAAENVAPQNNQMAISGYPIMFGNNNSGLSSENTTVTFTEADTYGLEINYRNWNSGAASNVSDEHGSGYLPDRNYSFRQPIPDQHSYWVWDQCQFGPILLVR